MALLKWVQSLGWWGNAVMVALLTCVHIPFMFGYAATGAACGLMYELGWGTVTIVVGGLVGCNVGYWVTRLLLREYILKQVENGRPEIKALMSEVGTHPWKISLVVRFIPIPIGFQNAMLAVCSMERARHGALLGMILMIAYDWLTRSIDQSINHD